MNGITILQGHAPEKLQTLSEECVNTVVTSPPYWGLRDYGIPPSVWPTKMSQGVVRCSNGDHLWADASWKADRWGTHDDDAPGEKQRTNGGSLGHRGEVRQASLCELCGAWRGCLGLEPTPELFVEHMVTVFREVKRVLRADGTLWLNMGDSYASDWPCNRRNVVGAGSLENGKRENRPPRLGDGMKPKDLCGIPWMLAFALRADGWYLRSDIIWHKPNPMPESVTDRPTKSHEYIFLLSKSERYYYDAEAILEPVSANTHARLAQDVAKQIGSERANGGAKTNGNMKAVGRRPKAWDNDMGSNRTLVAGYGRKLAKPGSGIKNNESFNEACCLRVEERNKRSVWTVNVQGFSEAHFATFPEELIKPCILAGCPAGGTVLDPFGGSGTTALVARANGCKAILIELNPEYIEIAKRRLAQEHLEFV